MDLGDGVFDLLALDGFFDRAMLDLLLQADEPALLERLGEVGEIAPGVDAVPFGAGFVLALLVLPALAGGKVEDGVVLLVLRGFGFCIHSETAGVSISREHSKPTALIEEIDGFCQGGGKASILLLAFVRSLSQFRFLGWRAGLD